MRSRLYGFLRVIAVPVQFRRAGLEGGAKGFHNDLLKEGYFLRSEQSCAETGPAARLLCWQVHRMVGIRCRALCDGMVSAANGPIRGA
jgi:hypothetical protein